MSSYSGSTENRAVVLGTASLAWGTEYGPALRQEIKPKGEAQVGPTSVGQRVISAFSKLEPLYHLTHGLPQIYLATLRIPENP